MCSEEDLLEIWIKIGRKNPWIREAEDPVFNISSFYKCESIEELQEELDKGNWCLGQAFHFENICFINQVNGGNEWLVIKDDIPFESISYKDYLSDEFVQFIKDVKVAIVGELKRLDYKGAASNQGKERGKKDEKRGNS